MAVSVLVQPIALLGGCAFRPVQQKAQQRLAPLGHVGAQPYGGRMRHEVTDADTAAALGSGEVPVLATPRLIAWMEAATVRAAAAFLATGQTTVGTAIRIEHRRATSPGAV